MERQIDRKVFRDGALICDEVVVTERVEQRLVPVDAPGIARRGPVGRRRRDPTTIRFEGRLEATFALELEGLVAGARDPDERRRRRGEGSGAAAIDIVLDRDRNLIEWPVRPPLDRFGPVGHVEFGSGHAEP